MKYVYPAIFHPNDDGSYTITYPDLPGCISEGKSLENALAMAQSALDQWMNYLEDDEKQAIPEASPIDRVAAKGNEFVNFIRVDTRDDRAIRRTVSLPKWMDNAVDKAGLSLSRVLQDALLEKLPPR